MDRRIELLEELGYYVAYDIQDIEKELSELKKFGYNCYFNSDKDRIELL